VPRRAEAVLSWHTAGVRAPFALLVAAGAACVLATVAVATISAGDGLPAYTDGYARWTKLNKKPITAPGAHTGTKNVYTSKPRGKSGKFPNGTVIVKSIAAPGVKGPPGEVAVMRKVAGSWRWIEYTRSGSSYTVLAQGQLCSACHMQAKARDWVFTRS
jgi:hypothetical protein